MIGYVLMYKRNGELLRDKEGIIISFDKEPSVYNKSKFTVISSNQEEINELIFNENLNKDNGLFDENN